MKNNCTFLLNSCDTFEDTWEPFFKCLELHWHNFDMPVVLNTESKQYSYKDLNIKSFSLYGESSNIPWGKRLKDTLKLIDTEYILFMLDDFFIVDDVNTEMIEKCFNYMNENKNISVFYFHHTPNTGNIKSDKYENFELLPKNGNYRFNCQAAIWRKDRLIDFIKEDESPWDWEIFGSIRSRKYNDEFYTIGYNVTEPINYNMYANGTAICRGKWVESIVVPLFKELDVDVDYSIRGFSPPNITTIDNRTFMQKVQTKLKKARAYLQSLDKRDV